MTRIRSESGQTIVFTVLFMSVIVGMAAGVLDVGSWYRADRATQAAADAAALAGAQALPESPGTASALASEYAVKNGGGSTQISVSTQSWANDTMTVRLSRPAPGLFSKLFGIDTVTVSSRAVARTGGPAEAMWVAPVVVNELHPQLVCMPACEGQPATIELINLHGPGSGDAAGAFGLLNLHGTSVGNVGSAELASWMSRGFDERMPLGTYDSVPSTQFNSSHFRDAIASRRGTEVLFPIYRSPILGSGSNARFNIIGWVGFHIGDFDSSGSTGSIDGHFTRVVWEGLQATSGGGSPDFGVRIVSLVE